jgi:hypothetical protein
MNLQRLQISIVLLFFVLGCSYPKNNTNPITIEVVGQTSLSSVVGESRYTTIKISNKSTYAHEIFSDINFPFEVERSYPDSCSFQEIKANETCSYKIKFSPASEDTFSFYVTANSITTNITGESLSQGQIELSVNSVDFGTISTGDSINQNITITNTGGSSFTFGSLSVNSEYSLNTTECPVVLPPGETCNASIEFYPKTASTAYSYRLEMSSDPLGYIDFTGVVLPSGAFGDIPLSYSNTMNNGDVQEIVIGPIVDEYGNIVSEGTGVAIGTNNIKISYTDSGGSLMYGLTSNPCLSSDPISTEACTSYSLVTDADGLVTIRLYGSESDILANLTVASTNGANASGTASITVGNP